MKHYVWQKMVKSGIFHKLQATNWRMKHYEQQEMVCKSGILHKLQVTCNEEWNLMNSKSRVLHIHQQFFLWKTQKDVHLTSQC